MSGPSRPKRIKIGPFDFTIDWIPAPLTVEDHPTPVLGFSMLSALRIVVCTEMAPDQERATLLHEILHMCIGVSGWENALCNGTVKKGYIEEAAVRALEAPLFGVLKQNPKLVEYLLG